MEAYEYYEKETGKLYYKEAALELELTDDYINWLERNVVKLFAIPDVSNNEVAVCRCKKPKRYIYGVRECEKCGKPLPKAN